MESAEVEYVDELNKMTLFVQASICFFFNIDVSVKFFVIYWAKVLPEQWGLLQIFKKHEIFRKVLRMHLEQAIIHLSISLNFILIKYLQITSFVNVLEGPTQNFRLQK